MSFLLGGILSIKNNRSLGRARRKSLKTTGLPIAKVTGEILEPASPVAVRAFQEQLVRVRRQDNIIVAFTLTLSLTISIGILLLMLGII